MLYLLDVFSVSRNVICCMCLIETRNYIVIRIKILIIIRIRNAITFERVFFYSACEQKKKSLERENIDHSWLTYFNMNVWSEASEKFTKNSGILTGIFFSLLLSLKRSRKKTFVSSLIRSSIVYYTWFTYEVPLTTFFLSLLLYRSFSDFFPRFVLHFSFICYTMGIVTRTFLLHRRCRPFFSILRRQFVAACRVCGRTHTGN